jgi:hypothetical protein
MALLMQNRAVANTYLNVSFKDKDAAKGRRFCRGSVQQSAVKFNQKVAYRRRVASSGYIWLQPIVTAGLGHLLTLASDR